MLDLTGLPEPVVKSIKQLVESLREGIASQGRSGAMSQPASLRGRFADLRLSIPKEDIDEAQREAWQDFPSRASHERCPCRHAFDRVVPLCLQPGAWNPTEGVLDDVKVSDVVMHDVTAPPHLSVKPGNTVGRVWVNRLTATGVNLAAASLRSTLHWIRGCTPCAMPDA